VADIFEALTADRPYRAAMPVDRALAILREQAGTALCPAAVAGLEASLAGEPAFTATLATTVGDHEGLRPPVRRPA
jgi:HD-GYP domain-containing protein (c-di-GMP phosphodiesterase class II)